MIAPEPSAPTAAAAEASTRRCDADGGAVLVEFALVFPLLMVLMLGMVSAGLAWNQQLQLTHAVREGARYGATVPRDEAFLGTNTWATVVRDLTISRAGGELEVSGATICVALVQGTGGTLRVVGTPAVPGTASGDYVVAQTRGTGGWNAATNNGLEPCIAGETYPVTTDDDGRRVQVTITRPGKIEALALSIPFTEKADATAKAESTA